MTTPYAGGDFFVPADDPPPPPERPAESSAPLPVFRASKPEHVLAGAGSGLVLPPGVRPVVGADTPQPASRTWTSPWPDGDLDRDYFTDDEEIDTTPAPRPPWVTQASAAPRRRMVPVRPEREQRAPRPEVDWTGNPVSPGLTADLVVRPRPVRPDGGWRRAVFDLTGGRWNPGPGAEAAARADRLGRIRSPLRGCHRVAVLSVKGGVGKTTVAAMLGLTFARLRGDRVLTIDANPDLGTLADRLTGDTEVGMQHLLDFLSDRPAFSISDIEHFVSVHDRLHVLAGSQEPCHGAAFTPDEYEEAIEALSSCYHVLIVDTGTGLSHAALAGVLATAHGVVIVGEPTVDAASRASMTLDWLAGSGFAELAAGAIVVMSQDRASTEVDEDVIREHFCPPRCAAVVEIPADPHLGNGGRIDMATCRPATTEAFEHLAAAVADAFPAPGPRRRLPGGR